MGHKVNPLIFRSKIFPYYNNKWNNFHSIYKYIKSYLNIKCFLNYKKHLPILYIQGNYLSNHYIYNIILPSKLIYFKYKQKIIVAFVEFIKKNYLKKIKISFNIMSLKHPLLSTYFILNYLSKKFFVTNGSLRKILPQLVLLINNKYKIKGFKCIISGRIKGAQMAKIETFKFNESSLQDKRSYIKYNFISVPTKYGLIGIKVWLFLN